MPRVTIDGLAERLGLSRAAVSYALNQQPGVSESTRERVLALALELGWQPSVSARSLSRSRADAIGLVLASPAEDIGSEPYYISLLAGIESAVSESGVALMLRFVPPGEDAEIEVYRRWHAERRVDAVLLVNLRIGDRRPAVLDGLRIPYFVHGGGLSGDGWQFDASLEAALLVDHLAELGHRRIAHVSGPLDLVHESQRAEGVTEEATARGLTALHGEADYTYDGAWAATAAILDANEPPTGFIYSSDLMALAGGTLLRERGLPDVAVTSWDDSVLCRTAVPGITALRRDPFGAGRRSARILLAGLAGQEEPSYQWHNTPLVVRDSSRPRADPAGRV
jgi:DNA-binding LacI/PurR family transcriptional regulator